MADEFALTIEPEDMKPVEMTDAIREHPLFLNFVKWLGDNRVPVDGCNYPRLWAKFLNCHTAWMNRK